MRKISNKFCINMNKVVIKPCGDRALLVSLGDTIDEAVNKKVNKLNEKLIQAALPGVEDTVPTYCSLLVNYSSKFAIYSQLKLEIEKLAANLDETETKEGRLLRIPCCYGGHFGPDMDFAVEHTGLPREEIIERHSAPVYKVYMLGFLPGFVYLGGLDPRLELPRLKSPRLAIPRGAVGIGGTQTGVYPMESPGGWRLLGATPLEFYDPDRPEPILCRAGDRIKFEPVSSCDYYDIRQEILRGTYSPAIEEAGNEH